MIFGVRSGFISFIWMMNLRKVAGISSEPRSLLLKEANGSFNPVAITNCISLDVSERKITRHIAWGEVTILGLFKSAGRSWLHLVLFRNYLRNFWFVGKKYNSKTNRLFNINNFFSKKLSWLCHIKVTVIAVYTLIKVLKITLRGCCLQLYKAYRFAFRIP